MADHEFIFALELSDEPHFDRMLSDLARTVLTYVGYSAVAADELRASIRGALAAGAAKGHHRCDVRFRAHAGELHIAVSYTGGVGWQTTRTLP